MTDQDLYKYISTGLFEGANVYSMAFLSGCIDAEDCLPDGVSGDEFRAYRVGKRNGLQQLSRIKELKESGLTYSDYFCKVEKSQKTEENCNKACKKASGRASNDPRKWADEYFNRLATDQRIKTLDSIIKKYRFNPVRAANAQIDGDIACFYTLIEAIEKRETTDEEFDIIFDILRNGLKGELCTTRKWSVRGIEEFVHKRLDLSDRSAFIKYLSDNYFASYISKKDKDEWMNVYNTISFIYAEFKSKKGVTP